MRLWHKDMIPVLPRQQLLGQWRECCAIAKAIAENGTPNHILVNRIMNFPQDEFNSYSCAVYEELLRRGYEADKWRFFKWRNDINTPPLSIIFRSWHNDRYLAQCLHNLQEKYDCGAISDEEWNRVVEKYPLIK